MRAGERQRGVGLLLLLLALPALSVADEGLPPLECVRLLREARVARLSDDAENALALLQLAAERYPGEMVVSLAMLEHVRETAGSAEELAKLRDELTRRLADPETPMPAATIDYLVRSPDLDETAASQLLTALRKRTADDASNLDSFSAILELQMRLEQFDEARGWLGKRIELDPAPEWHMHCLELDFRQELWEHAPAHIENLLQHDPASPGLRLSELEVLGRLGRHDELLAAIESFEGELDVYSVDARGALGSLVLELAWNQRDIGADERAELFFRQVLRLDPENAVARNSILHLYSSAEERATHENQLEQQWESEDDPYVLLEEGGSALASGDAQRAFELLKRSVAALPGNEIAQYNLGLCAIRLEEWDAAEQALAAAIAINPGRAESHLSRGIALQRLDRCPEAIAQLTRTIELQPDLTQAHYYLYECLNKLGQTDKAREHLAKYNASVAK